MCVYTNIDLAPFADWLKRIVPCSVCVGACTILNYELSRERDFMIAQVKLGKINGVALKIAKCDYDLQSLITIIYTQCVTHTHTHTRQSRDTRQRRHNRHSSNFKQRILRKVSTKRGALVLHQTDTTDIKYTEQHDVYITQFPKVITSRRLNELKYGN